MRTLTVPVSGDTNFSKVAWGRVRSGRTPAGTRIPMYSEPPIQLLQLLKNCPREVKRVHFRYILGPPGSHPGNGIDGARRGRSPPVPPVSPAMSPTERGRWGGGAPEGVGPGKERVGQADGCIACSAQEHRLFVTRY